MRAQTALEAIGVFLPATIPWMADLSDAESQYATRDYGGCSVTREQCAMILGCFRERMLNGVQRVACAAVALRSTFRPASHRPARGQHGRQSRQSRRQRSRSVTATRSSVGGDSGDGDPEPEPPGSRRAATIGGAL